MNNKVWVVMTNYGEYSDHYENIEGIFTTKEKAMECVDIFIKKYDLIQDDYAYKHGALSWETKDIFDYYKNDEFNGVDLTEWDLDVISERL